ncbi:MAG: sigma-70 family RNA polymerase sigma factor [Rhodospirillales bacterium]
MGNRIGPDTLIGRMARGAANALAEPRLSREEERALIEGVRSGDRAAVARLVASQMRCVRRVAWRYRRFGQPFGDLVQEGVVGLMEALKRFNPERDVRLATYAMWWIRASIQDYVIRSSSLVRIGTTATQKTLFFRLARTRRPAGGAEPVSADAAAALAARFGVPAAEVVALAHRMRLRDRPLDGGPSAPGEVLPDGRPTPEEEAAAAQERHILQRLLPRALALLPPRERLIIERRFFADRGATREGIGAELGVSKERVRQLEQRALGELRRLLALT